METVLEILRAESNQSKSAKSAGTRLFRLLQVLEGTSNISYILDGQYRFIYCNPAWDEFAESNAAPPLLLGDSIIGYQLFDSIPSALRDAYSNAFRQVAEKGRVWDKLYECSSPTLFRKYLMRIYPMERWGWFLVTNALVVSRQHQAAAPPDESTYFKDGIVVLCAHCRCSQRVDVPTQWDFVPDYLQFKGLESVRVSHRLCPVCQHHYYPQIL